MGMNSLAIERDNSFQSENTLSSINFEKKYIIGKGGFSKVINYYLLYFLKIFRYIGMESRV
jgi:hypothetical protein